MRARVWCIAGFELRFGGADHRIDFGELTGGRAITVYGQQELVKDLIEIRLAAGTSDSCSRSATSQLHDIDTDHPSVSYAAGRASAVTIECDVIAGCDGFHGVSRDSIPAGVLTTYEREYPFAWLGILASCRAVERRAHLLLSRARLRAAQHAVAHRQPPVSAGARG